MRGRIVEPGIKRTHALDIAAFISSVTIRSMTYTCLQKMTYWEDTL